jgi:hypothetical protein
MKTCEELGWKVGDRFICIKEDSLSEGDIVELDKDDGSTCPRFKLVYPEDQYVYEYTSCFEPLIEEKTMTPAEELGYKVGDEFVVLKETTFTKGSIVSLFYDDGSNEPKFKLISGKCFYDLCGGDPGAYIGLEYVEQLEDTNKYIRTIHGVEVDVYDVLNAWEVTCPATQHAIKKLLMPGQRGSKDALQDLKEAEQAIKRAIELEEG